MDYYPKKSMWKWILLYLVIGAVAYGLIYYFFFVKNGNYNSQNYQTQNQTQSNNSETGNWEMYKNNEHGFEFKYPKDWLLKIYNDSILVVLTSPENEQLINQGKLAYTNFSVGYYKDANEFAKNLEQRLDLKGNEYKNLDDLFKDKGWWDIKKIGELIIDDKKWHVVTQSNGNSYAIIIENNGIYKLNFPSTNPKIGVRNVEKDILSTFKFTK